MSDYQPISESRAPSELRLNRDKDQLSISFETGDAYNFSAEFLRVHSPSAEVQGHSPAERRTVAGKRNVRIEAIEPVGNYAVRIRFSDGHDTGIYSWDYFHELGQVYESLWQHYLSELESKGLSRD